MRHLAFLFLISCVEYNPEGHEPPVWPPPMDVPVQNVHQTDYIVQVQEPMADVLWVVDNSCSMSNEQNSLTGNFPAFIDFFIGSGLNYHIGVVSTDLDNIANGSKGTLTTAQGYKFIDPDTVDPVGVFTAMATLGTTGSGTEKGLGATYMALETNKDTVNAGFYRDPAALHTIIISDEPDYTDASLITQSEFVNWYDGLKSENDLRTFSSIVATNSSTYLLTTQDIGGITWDIATDDWQLVLEQLGMQAAGYKTEFFLTQLPIVDTIAVSIDDPTGVHLVFETTDWTYSVNRNSIKFLSYVPNALATVIIDYDLLATATPVDSQDNR